MKNNKTKIVKSKNKKKVNVKENPFGKQYVRNMMFIMVLLLSLMVFLYSFIIPFVNYEVAKYKNVVPNDVYLDGISIASNNLSSLEKSIEEVIEKFNQRTVIFSNINGIYEYKMEDLHLSFNDKEIIEDIKDKITFMGQVKKILGIKSKSHYKLEIVEDNSFNNFISALKEKTNTDKVNGVFVRDSDYNISFVGYKYGFVLNDEEFISDFKNSIYNEDNVFELPGEIVNFDNYKLLAINKKIAEYTTDYSGNSVRKKNVELAIKKLNGTVLYPNDVFSYYKVVGPYNANNGYKYYYNLVGSGVCQVSTNLYAVELLAGLKTVYRAPHGKKVWYVPGGLDATVYGSTTDFKFRNTYEYPLYINSYAKGNNIYISIWSNEKVNEDIVYKLRSVKTGNLSYKVYRDVYEKNKLVKTELVNSTKYYDSY